MTNPELDQDRAYDLYDTYKKYGYVMFPQQRRIYEQLHARFLGANILEIGCGNGVGTAMLSRDNHLLGTDKLYTNIKFARELYPWIPFEVYDVSMPWGSKRDVVVAVEVIEHVTDPVKALRNMLDIATKEVWISTPNGKHAKKPPENPYHVAEYTTGEMLSMFIECWANKVDIFAWDNLSEPVTPLTDATPLVYRVRK